MVFSFLIVERNMFLSLSLCIFYFFNHVFSNEIYSLLGALDFYFNLHQLLSRSTEQLLSWNIIWLYSWVRSTASWILFHFVGVPSQIIFLQETRGEITLSSERSENVFILPSLIQTQSLVGYKILGSKSFSFGIVKALFTTIPWFSGLLIQTWFYLHSETPVPTTHTHTPETSRNFFTSLWF